MSHERTHSIYIVNFSTISPLRHTYSRVWTHPRHPVPWSLGLAREAAVCAETSHARRSCPAGSAAAPRARQWRAEGGALSASSIDGDGRSVEALTLRALKTYEDRGPTFQFFGAFPIILIHEWNFQMQFPAKFVEKRIAQMVPLHGI